MDNKMLSKLTKRRKTGCCSTFKYIMTGVREYEYVDINQIRGPKKRQKLEEDERQSSFDIGLRNAEQGSLKMK